MVRRRLDRDAWRIHRDDEHADAGMRRPGVLVGSRREEHVFAPPGRGPDLLAIDDPVIAVLHRAGAQRGEVGAGLWFAVTHAVHGLATKDLRQVFLLLLRCAEHHQCVGLDRRADPRRLAPLHRLHERDLFQRRTRLAAEVFRPAEADPSGCADIARKVRVELPLGERPIVERGLACLPSSSDRAIAAPARAARCRPDRDRIAAAARRRRSSRYEASRAPRLRALRPAQSYRDARA